MWDDISFSGNGGEKGKSVIPETLHKQEEVKNKDQETETKQEKKPNKIGRVSVGDDPYEQYRVSVCVCVFVCLYVCLQYDLLE